MKFYENLLKKLRKFKFSKKSSKILKPEHLDFSKGQIFLKNPFSNSAIIKSNLIIITLDVSNKPKMLVGLKNPLKASTVKCALVH
ncbi:hypothetical protein BpHYR1_003203 [Brachionus plicatilis]|uniref:Uncharacterized protein n=1 Tax=Brachionus plicatilis TaxID=10195 RepID=A0A3M7SKM8_BRAPC|nr:hypothetical protein BpHYR1_003203 [Brachionus plicatilis]